MGAEAVSGAVLIHFLSTCLISTVFLTAACDPLRRPGDTTGDQRSARWEWSGRLAVETDSVLTLVRLRIDTAGVTGRHDILLARFDFDPSSGMGDEYALTVGLDLGVARDLPIDQPLPLGPPPARIPAYGTVTRLGTPLRPDSVRGSLLLSQRGLRQLTGRIDATFYFTAWNDSTRHSRYELHQEIFGVK